MNFDEVRKALRFRWSEQNIYSREAWLCGSMIASFNFNSVGPIFISLFDKAGRLICNVYYSFMEQVVSIVVAHAFILESEPGISHEEHLRILRKFMK